STSTTWTTPTSTSTPEPAPLGPAPPARHHQTNSDRRPGTTPGRPARPQDRRLSGDGQIARVTVVTALTSRSAGGPVSFVAKPLRVPVGGSGPGRTPRCAWTTCSTT